HFDRDKYPNVDGVFALTHQHGCSVAAFPEGYDLMQRTLAGYVRHPNFGGMVVIGLGCEDNPVGALMKEHDLPETATRKIFEIQSEGGTKSTVQAGIEAVEKLLEEANQDEREEVSISELTLALQCGGSDGFSAIGANPALGVASDLLATAGGSSILSETPEIFGVHHLLKARAVDPSVALEVDQLMDWWLDHAKRWDGSLDDNKTEGNAEGGLTTIIEKALGSASKGGHGPLMDVRRYGQPLREKGLTFMDSPGNDWVSVTGQVATGANIVAFTTGRGSVFGCRPAPSVKLATNSRLYSRMEDDMDINCGPVVEGEISLVEKGCEILETLIETASGKLTKSEELGFGQEEMSPWVISGTV
ncbi:MAG: UxaA family hydrolase, partial [Pseudomonadota bacterium]